MKLVRAASCKRSAEAPTSEATCSSRVAVPVPASRSADLPRSRRRSPRPAVGARVVVPLGSRIVTGIVVDDGASRPRADRADDDQADSAGARRRAVRAAGRRRAAPAGSPSTTRPAPGDAIAAVLPPKTRAGDARRRAQDAARGARLPRRRDPERGVRRRSRAKQRDALRRAGRRTPTGLPTRSWRARGVSRRRGRAARRARGSSRSRQERVERDPFASSRGASDRGR